LYMLFSFLEKDIYSDVTVHNLEDSCTHDISLFSFDGDYGRIYVSSPQQFSFPFVFSLTK
jgi:hypothetical protein